MNGKRPMVTAGVLLLTGEAAYLEAGENKIISAVMLLMAAAYILSNRKCGQKKCSYLLLFCCLAAGLLIGAAASSEMKEKNLLIGEYVKLEGKIEEVREGEKSIGVVVNAGGNKVAIYMKRYTDCMNNGRLSAGRHLKAEGILEEAEGSTNPGSFDLADYYSGKGITGVLYTDTAELTGKTDYILYKTSQLKSEIRDELYKYFSSDRASLLSAMLLGEKSGQGREEKLLYQKNGLAHIFAISGMHVALIALAFEKLFEMIGMGRKLRYCLVTLIVILYGIMTGFGPPMVRAVIMLLMRYAAFVLKRTPDAPTDMMLALLLIAIVNPASIFTPGLRLSFTAAVSMYISDRIYINYFGWRKLIFMGTDKERHSEKKNTSGIFSFVKRFISGTNQKRLKERLKRTVISTLVINAAMAPLLIYYFYEIYPYGMLLGILLIPTVTYVIAGGFITAILGMMGMTFAASPAAIPVNAALGLYERLCDSFLGLPGSAINPGHVSMWICLLYFGLISVLTVIILRKGKRKKRRSAAVYFMTIYILLGLFLYSTFHINQNRDRIVVLDVGQGMSTLVHLKNGGNYIFDGGSTSKDSVGEYVMIPALKYYGMSDIDGIFISHTDSDHINGIIEAAETARLYRLKLGPVYMASGTRHDENYDRLEAALGRKTVPLSEGDIVDGSFTVIYPDAEDSVMKDGSDTVNSGNEYSLVIRMDAELNSKRISVLFPGDIGEETEKRVIEECRRRRQDISSDILIVPHHGSAYSSSSGFLSAVSADVAVISCGRRNIYGHPAPETIARLNTAGAKIIRTDTGGAVIIE